MAPAAGDQLVFSGGTRPATVNDFPAGTPFDEITFTSSGFTLSGNRVTLNPLGGMAIDDAGDQDTLALPITLGTDGTFEVTGRGGLESGVHREHRHRWLRFDGGLSNLSERLAVGRHRGRLGRPDEDGRRHADPDGRQHL